jgi:hypothetical protein
MESKARDIAATSFYRPRRSAEETDLMLTESQTLHADEFRARYGVQPGYMTDTNEGSAI